MIVRLLSVGLRRTGGYLNFVLGSCRLVEFLRWSSRVRKDSANERLPTMDQEIQELNVKMNLASRRRCVDRHTRKWFGARRQTAKVGASGQAFRIGF
jgi:hypothetical protein